MTRTAYAASVAYVTRDGSTIRELMHPSRHGNRRQSLAEATVEPGARTALHVHRLSEEIYHVTAGEGQMTLGDECFAVRAGDTVCIAPGTPHCIANHGAGPLRFLCACAPAYSHDDTQLL
jgi:mannose-6-phosphate isomerase-like protein (cupin superfamily)